MNLRQLAEQDMRAIMGDTTSGFGWPITITDPAGNSGAFTGFSTDISQVIDPDTGQVVSGRAASVSVPLGDFLAKGMAHPKGGADSTSRPWVVQFDDINGTTHKFKVSDPNPDRALGVVVLVLEAYA